MSRLLCYIGRASANVKYSSTRMLKTQLHFLVLDKCLEISSLALANLVQCWHRDHGSLTLHSDGCSNVGFL